MIVIDFMLDSYSAGTTGDHMNKDNIVTMSKIAFLVMVGILALTSIGDAAYQQPACSGKQIDPIKKALGYQYLADLDNGVKLEGDGRYRAMPCSFSYILCNNGAWRRDVVNPLGDVKGYDGEEGWQVDDTGMPSPLQLRDLETSTMIAWVIGGYWLHPDCPVQFNEPRGSDSVNKIALKYPSGHVNFQLEIDENSLPAKLTWYDDKNREKKWELQEYDSFKGYLVPTKISYEASGHKIQFNVMKTVNASAEEIDKCKPITSRPKDTTFADKTENSKDGCMPLKWVPTGNFLVKPEVNGEDVGWFLLDTGAARNAIDGSVAEKLGLQKIGGVAVSGVGGTVEAAFRVGESISLGYVTIKDPKFIEIGLKRFEPFMGCPLGGVLGYDFLARVLVNLDLKNNRLRLDEPGSWADKEVAWEKLEFENNLPYMECEMEGEHSGLFYLDTGSAYGIDLNAGFVRKTKILEGREVQLTMGGGVGGFETSYSGLLEWFRLGSLKLENPPAVFNKSQSETLNDTAVAGYIGCEALAEISIYIDYPNRRIAFHQE